MRRYEKGPGARGQTPATDDQFLSAPVPPTTEAVDWTKRTRGRWYWPLAPGPWPLVALALLFLSACSSIQRDPPIIVWWDMKRQAKFRTQGETGLFADGRNTRPPVEDTVARGYVVEDTAYNTGMEGGMYIGKNPVPITPELLQQGQSRFNTYCSPCHDKTGSGRGIVPTHIPTWQPANLMDDRLVEEADGDLFYTITNGRRTMPPYKFQVTTADRWAIIAYVRVLQRAAHGTVNDVPAEQRADLK